MAEQDYLCDKAHHFCCGPILTISKMNDDLSKLTNAQLIDILCTQTSLLVQMHIQGADKVEFEKCNSLIEAVHREIKSRKEIQLEQVK